MAQLFSWDTFSSIAQTEKAARRFVTAASRQLYLSFNQRKLFFQAGHLLHGWISFYSAIILYHNLMFICWRESWAAWKENGALVKVHRCRIHRHKECLHWSTHKYWYSVHIFIWRASASYDVSFNAAAATESSVTMLTVLQLCCQLHRGSP